MDRFFLGALAAFFLMPSVLSWADDEPAVLEAEAPAAPVSELEKLKGEWEAVREQQIQMIREKEDQLEKLKEEIFAKMRSQDAPAAPLPETSGTSEPVLAVGDGVAAIPAESPGVEAQRAALRAERQKFFTEMNRQKENLLKAQAALEEKEKQFEAERQAFEAQKTEVPS